MSYRYYNANPLNKYEEDCTIRSISCAIDKSWDYVYNMLSDRAQAKRTMMDDREFIIDFLDSNYNRVPYLPETVGEVSGMYPDSILLITMNGHIVCSKYGVIYDTFDPRNRYVEEAWIVS